MSDYTPQQLDRGLVNAVDIGDLSAVRSFVEDGANVDARDASGVPVLQLAVLARDEKLVELLLSLGAGVDLQSDRSKSTALHCAAEKGAEKVMRILLRHRADPNILNNAKETPLHVVATSGSLPAAELLVRTAVNPLTVSAGGQTALEKAEDFCDLVHPHLHQDSFKVMTLIRDFTNEYKARTAREAAEQLYQKRTRALRRRKSGPGIT